MSARVFYYRAKRSMTPEEQIIANTYPNGLDMDRDAFAHNSLIRFSVVRDDDPEKAEIQKMIFETGFEDIKMDRAVGSVLGAPIGDSLGAPLEFSDVRYGSTELQDMGQESVWQKRTYNSFNLKPGQWTDDASMALCCADSLLVSKGFNARDLRLRFLNWYHYGYNNAFGYDDGQRHSIGLGGNISMSMGEFERNRFEYTSAGDRFTSGNGSIMRLSPTPVYYWDDYEKALDASYKQSKTTHQGDEAAECCRIMAHIIVTAINHPSEGDVPKSILDDLPETFKTDLYSARCLADSKQEERCEDNKGQDLKDRNWNWKDENFRFSPTRSRQQPGYIGSYAMDGLAMALHCVYTTSSFREACLKSANMRGDADSYTSVTAQLAGAIYGCRAIPKHWIQYVQQWDNNGSIALRAYKLYTKHDL